MTTLHQKRFLAQAGFFILFVLAPPLDIFRIDLNLKHLIFFGHDWTLGLDPLLAGEIGAGQAALNIVLYGFLPLVAVVGVFGFVSWKWGRLYCGWLCPHFSVVETINGLMERAIGKPSLWDRKRLPERRPDGSRRAPRAAWWGVTLPFAAGFAFLWALVLLTYLLPPTEIYGNLVSGALTRNQSIFLIAATTVFLVDFLFARHLFCRYGCAVGLFQSLVWMANRRAMVIGFNARRAHDCVGCESACDNACPMRLTPRAIKRRMFTCDNCGACVDACTTVQGAHGRASLLQYVSGDCALDKSERDFGYRPPVPSNCFSDGHVSGRRVIPISIARVASGK
ncbi:MAG TPA: 4Fe-4S binding protein [Acidiferrobacterales bacterium]